MGLDASTLSGPPFSLPSGDRHPRTVQIAVVVPTEVKVLAAMRTDAVVRFVLHGGSELRVEDETDEWLRVSLPDGQQGWMERRHLEVRQL